MPSSQGDKLAQDEFEVMKLPKLYTPQPAVEIEVYRSQNMYLDWEAASETYFIHRDFMRYYSYLFRSEYDSALPTTKLRIAYAELSSLGRFIEYTYSQEIDLTDLDHKDFIFLWILAEKIGAPQLQNYTISCLHDFQDGRSSACIPIQMLSYLRLRTREGSPLKRYIQDTSEDAQISGDRKIRVRIRDYFLDEKVVAKAFLEPVKKTAWADLDKVAAQQMADNYGAEYTYCDKLDNAMRGR